MSIKPEGPAWGALNGQSLIWEEFGDDSVVFNGLSGETHLLNLTAAEILLLLQERPRTLKETVEEIAEKFETGESEALAEQISGVLKEFEYVGLICTAPTCI